MGRALTFAVLALFAFVTGLNARYDAGVFSFSGPPGLNTQAHQTIHYTQGEYSNAHLALVFGYGVHETHSEVGDRVSVWRRRLAPIIEHLVIDGRPATISTWRLGGADKPCSAFTDLEVVGPSAADTLSISGCGDQSGLRDLHRLYRSIRFPASKPDVRLAVSPYDSSIDPNTKCRPENFYADGKVPPAFYQSSEDNPAYEKFISCVEAEAEAKGMAIRLADAGDYPKIGTCYLARITSIGSRFADDSERQRPMMDFEEGGTTVTFDNEIHLVDYGLVREILSSRVGDAAKVCVTALPPDCPANDLRGLTYKVLNLRTGKTWELPNSQHLCRGA